MGFLTIIWKYNVIIFLLSNADDTIKIEIYTLCNRHMHMQLVLVRCNIAGAIVLQLI